MDSWAGERNQRPSIIASCQDLGRLAETSWFSADLPPNAHSLRHFLLPWQTLHTASSHVRRPHLLSASITIPSENAGLSIGCRCPVCHMSLRVCKCHTRGSLLIQAISIHRLKLLLRTAIVLLLHSRRARKKAQLYQASSSHR